MASNNSMAKAGTSPQEVNDKEGRMPGPHHVGQCQHNSSMTYAGLQVFDQWNSSPSSIQELYSHKDLYYEEDPASDDKVEELRFAASHEQIMQFVPIDYHAYLHPLMEDLAFMARLACAVQDSLRDLKEHKENGTIPPVLRHHKPESQFDRGYAAKIRKRQLDILIAHKEASLELWQQKLDPAVWVPEWNRVLDSAWHEELSKHLMAPIISKEGGVSRLVGWRPSDESEERQAQVIRDVPAIGKQVIHIENIKYQMADEERVKRKAERQPLRLRG
ncbi:hypothetical protein F5141DRAFT_1068535 [Pisolithus sp. B1]|nr:hypothetical protein F5141DRAFT_1068535 [Pisolithus sp. B1]